MTGSSVKDGRLLIYAPVPVYSSPEGWFLERQAANGLRLWAEHFDHVTVMMPHEDGPPPTGWILAEGVGPNLERMKIVPLPAAWVLPKFIQVYRKTRNTIRQEIGRADYLSFAIGGLVGDWGAVSCLQAHAMGRRFGAWTDAVESEIVRVESGSGSGSLKSRIKKRVIYRPMSILERFVIKRSTVGLFHGQQTYDAYAPYCSNPNIVHDIHVSRDSHITDEAFKLKIASAKSDPLHVVYAGRAISIKGPLQWASALKKLSSKGVPFEAHWLGDGLMLEELRAQIEADGLANNITLHGYIDDQVAVAARLQAAHVFLFCHTTPESPRCLIESLIAGTPIVGYDGSYASDLIGKAGGGLLAPIGDTDALGRFLISLATDRDKLIGLIRNAREDGKPFDDEAVFAHRSELIKQFLGR
jgi:glycosyltransferase involved in cell wall biosynthesis